MTIIEEIRCQLPTGDGRWEQACDSVCERLGAILNARGDDLCWITDPEQAKALPENEFLESCRRYRLQLVDGRGEVCGLKTIAQLEARIRELEAWPSVLAARWRLRADEDTQQAVNLSRQHAEESAAYQRGKADARVGDAKDLDHYALTPPPHLRCECGATFPDTAMYWHHAGVFHGRGSGVLPERA